MRKIISLTFALAIASLVAVISSCQPEELEPPQVKTQGVYDVGRTKATVFASVVTYDGSKIIEQGVEFKEGKRVKAKISSEQNFETYLRDLEPGTLYQVRSYASNAEHTGYGEFIEFKTLDPIPEPDPFEGLSVEPNFVKLDSTDAEPYRMTINVGIRDVIDPYSYSYLIEYSPYTGFTYPEEGAPTYKGEAQVERVDDHNLNLSLLTDSILYPNAYVGFRVIATNSDGKEFISEEFNYLVPKSNFVKELDNITSVVYHLVRDIKADEEGNIYVCGIFDEGDGKSKGFIVKFNKDEEVLWRVNSNPPPNFLDGYHSLAIEDGILYAQLGRDYRDQGAGFIQAFNASDGSLIWETQTTNADPNTYNVAVREGMIYSSGGPTVKVSSSGELVGVLRGFHHCVYPIKSGILVGSRGADDNNYQALLEFYDNDFNLLSAVQDSMKRGDDIPDPFASIIYFEDENLIITVKYASYLPLPAYNYLEAYTLVDNQLKLVWSKNIGKGRSLRLAKYGKSIAIASRSEERLRKGPALYDLSGNLIWELGIPAVDGLFTIIGNRMYLVNLATLRRVDLPKL